MKRKSGASFWNLHLEAVVPASDIKSKKTLPTIIPIHKSEGI